MNEQKDEKRLDEVIFRAIGSGSCRFDAKRWKEKYAEEFQLLQSRAGDDSTRRVGIEVRL